MHIVIPHQMSMFIRNSHILTDVLMYLFRNYKPDNIKKATFTTALRYVLNRRTNDYFTNRLRDRHIWGVSFDQLLEQFSGDDDDYDKHEHDGKESDHTVFDSMRPSDSPDVPNDLQEEINLFVRLAPFICEQRKMEGHRPPSKQMWFERFYTFDITKLVKMDEWCAKDAIKVSESFQIMCSYVFISGNDAWHNADSKTINCSYRICVKYIKWDLFHPSSRFGISVRRCGWQ